MSVESSFLKDRPATFEELRNLEYETPVILGKISYEDILRVNVVGEETGEIEIVEGAEVRGFETENWYFRMN